MKLDLHRHLEGSHSASALAAVAIAHDIRAPLFFDVLQQRHRTAAELAPLLVMRGPTDDASEFYACIVKARAAYVSEAAIGDLARRAFVEAAEETDGCEMRISLFSMARTLLENEGLVWRDVAPIEFAERARRVLLVVLAARDAAVTSTNKLILVRVGFSRTFESAPHYTALAAMLREHKHAICGLDVLGIVGGADKEPMPAALQQILIDLRGDFADLTIHAGEFEDHRCVDRMLALSPQGIGHGVRSVQSDALMAKLASGGVTLEICPHSNHLLIPTVLRALVEQRGMHPLRALQQHDVHCVLGSDDPTPMGTTFGEEWQRAIDLDVDMGRLSRDSLRRWAQLPAPR